MSETPGAGALLSLATTAGRLGITPRTLHRWNSAGKGPKSYKVGHRWKYRADEVEAWLERRASDRNEATE